MPEITCGGLTDRGRLRKRNEDNLYMNPEQRLFIVSDGMGGHAAGNIASKMVVELLPRMIYQRMNVEDLSDPRAVKQILSALFTLNNQVLEEGMKETSRTGMGATVVLLLMRGTKALVAHMGDSRLYLLRQRRMVQVTRDHSVIQELLDAKKITPEEATRHPVRGQITSCIGMPHFTKPGTQVVNLVSGDRFLLCSDGLTGMVPGQSIASMLLDHPKPQEACDALVQAANAAGGVDNITVVVVDWQGENHT